MSPSGPQQTSFSWLGPMFFPISPMGPGPGLDTWEDSGYTGELILGTRTIPGAVHTPRLPSPWGRGQSLWFSLPSTQHRASSKQVLCS